MPATTAATRRPAAGARSWLVLSRWCGGSRPCGRSRPGEQPQGFDERYAEEDGPGHERGDGHRHPHLLAAALQRLDQAALDVAADGPRLLRQQAAQVSGVAV